MFKIHYRIPTPLISPSTVVHQGTCTPSLGATYNVFVAEGCIPERDYISEMQDTSNRVSKQVKIYLRRFSSPRFPLPVFLSLPS